jgi:hypothetical protein
MEDYIEEYKYNNCFWKKSGVLYTHSDLKYEEFMSVGTIFQKLGAKIEEFCDFLDTIDKSYKKPNEPDYSRGEGIQVILSSMKKIKNELTKLYALTNNISNKIFDKKETYESKKPAAKMCDEAYKKYDAELNKLKIVKKAYFDSMNKVVESYLNQNYGKKVDKNKAMQDFQNKKKNLEKKKLEYKKVLNNVEALRIEYMQEQGNLFEVKEELEKENTEDLKLYFQQYIKGLDSLSSSLQFSEEDIKKIENINGDYDCKKFAEANKSLMTGPGRNPYKEYAVDLNYYTENFEVIKAKLKGKTSIEKREFQHKISNEISDLLKDLIKEERTEVIDKIEAYAKDLKENKLSKEGYDFLIQKFDEQYNTFMKWKQEIVCDQDFKKVGKDWDERFLYMTTFLKYFNKTRIDSKELNEENFNYLCGAIKKIFDLNENEDIDYNLCDLAVILSSTYYMADPKANKGKKYVNEIVKNATIMQKQGFWVGLTKYQLNEEIQKQNKIEDTLKEDNISEEKLNNSVIAKLMSVSFNIMTFVLDSNLFNKILFDVFKYCKINNENKQFIIQMLKSQIDNEKITYLTLDEDFLLSTEKEQQ